MGPDRRNLVDFKPRGVRPMGCNLWCATHGGQNVGVCWIFGPGACNPWGATYGFHPMGARMLEFGGFSAVQPMGCNPWGPERGNLVDYRPSSLKTKVEPL